MRTIGFRADPNGVTFVVFDSEANALVNAETILIPKALPNPEALKYVRNNVLDVLEEYGVERAGIRITESAAQRPSIRRLELEGVIQEAFASSTLRGYYSGQIASISRRVGIPREHFKPLVNGEENYQAVQNWMDLSQHEREATLAAIGALHA